MIFEPPFGPAGRAGFDTTVLSEPFTLLVGNGPVRVLGGPSWESFIGDAASDLWSQLAGLTYPEAFAVLEREQRRTAYQAVERQCSDIDSRASGIQAGNGGGAWPVCFQLLRRLYEERRDVRFITTNYDHALELLFGIPTAPERLQRFTRLVVEHSHAAQSTSESRGVLKLHGDACNLRSASDQGVVLGLNSY